MAISLAFSVILLGGAFWSDPYRQMKASMAFPFRLADVNFVPNFQQTVVYYPRVTMAKLCFNHP
jgi:hypothetical protein